PPRLGRHPGAGHRRAAGRGSGAGGLNGTELRRLARSCGVLTEYKDVFQRRRRPRREALLAVLGVLLGTPGASAEEIAGAARDRAQHRSAEPVLVAWDGR